MDFYYPWLPKRCKLCDKWGHGEKVCALKGKGKVQEVQSILSLKVGDEMNGNKDLMEEDNREKEVASVEVSTKEQSPKVDNKEEEVSDGNDGSWSQVPQGKAGRSQPSTPKQMMTEIHISS